MPLKYAAYGSNLHPHRLRERTGTVTLLGTTPVDGLALRFHKRGNLDGSGKCNIIEEEDARVYLAVFEIQRAGLAALDMFEGVGSGYRRTTIELPEYGACLTYRAQSSHIDESLTPFDWYKDLVLAGCRYHGFPEPYIDLIEKIAAEPDPNSERKEIHQALLRTMAGSSVTLSRN